MAGPGGGRYDALGRAARFVGVGFEFAGTVVAGVLVGNWLDRAAGTEPLFTLVITLGATAGAVYRLIWSLNRFNSGGGAGTDGEPGADR